MSCGSNSIRTKAVYGRQRYFKKTKGNTSHSYTHADVRCSISTKFCIMIEVVRAIISSSKHFGSHSLAARGHRKFGWKRPQISKLFIILSFIEKKQPNLAVEDAHKTCKFCKNTAGHPLFISNYSGKIPIFKFLMP